MSVRAMNEFMRYIVACFVLQGEQGKWVFPLTEARKTRMAMQMLMKHVSIMLLGLVVIMQGCTPSEYARQADLAGESMIASARQVAFGESKPLGINFRPMTIKGTGPEAHIEVGGREILVADEEPGILGLQDSLAIAFRNSIDFQNRREELFLSALSVANARRGWDWPRLGGQVEGEAFREVQNKGATVNSGLFSAGPTLAQRLKDGGTLAVAATLQLATDMMGGEGTSVGSLIEGNFTQPLLRGAWRGLAYEPVYRQERDFLIKTYEYDRFAQTFAVDIISNYYQVLRQRDVLMNDSANVERLRRTVSLTRVQVESGTRSRIELDQAQQNLLDAEVRLEQSSQQYRDGLDRFKITLGLPVVVHVELDPAELADLRESGPRELPFDESTATQIAFSTRPDVLMQAAAVRDAERNIEIAADAFLPRLDAQFSISAGNTGQDDFWNVRTDRHTRRVGLVLNYPIDQTDNRDAYRSAQIAFDRARRQYTQFLDNVRLDVRQTHRLLVQTYRTYELQLRNVEIATRRTQLANLQQTAGLVSARDVLEAEEALRNARNGLTSALVNYTNTRLNFLARLGMIYVTDEGTVNERTEPYEFDRIVRRYAYLDATQ